VGGNGGGMGVENGEWRMKNGEMVVGFGTPYFTLLTFGLGHSLEL